MVIKQGYSDQRESLNLISMVKTFVQMKWKWAGSGSDGDFC